MGPPGACRLPFFFVSHPCGSAYLGGFAEPGDCSTLPSLRCGGFFGRNWLIDTAPADCGVSLVLGAGRHFSGITDSDSEFHFPVVLLLCLFCSAQRSGHHRSLPCRGAWHPAPAGGGLAGLWVDSGVSCHRFTGQLGVRDQLRLPACQTSSGYPVGFHGPLAMVYSRPRSSRTGPFYLAISALLEISEASRRGRSD